VGQCATFGGEDTRTDAPFVEGIVLVGDAAGYNDPLIGQGLSLALRDTRMLSEILLTKERWSPESLLPYGDERRGRLQRVRFTAALNAELFATFGLADVPAATAFSAADFRGRALPASLGIGPDRSPEWAYTEDFRTEVLG